MKLIEIKLSNIIKDSVLDALPVPQCVSELKVKLKPLLSDEEHQDISDLINELYVEALDTGYDAGFRTANTLTAGKTDVYVDAK